MRGSISQPDHPDADEPVVKRIAMALANTYAAQRQALHLEQGLFVCVETCWQEWIAEARAVLVAIREPTHIMYMIGGNSEPYSRAKNAPNFSRMRGRIGDLPARDAWRLMIDQALKEDVG